MFMKWIVIYITCFFYMASSYAGVVLGGTRLVYDAGKAESALFLKNTEKDRVFLVQSWVDNYDMSVQSDVPFVIIPPLFRLDKGKEGIIRIKGIPNNLPQDKESVFLLNVKAIAAADKPSEENKNTLQVSILSRIKLFYRPDKLTIKPEDVPEKIQAKKENGKLRIINPTPYYVSFYKLKFNNKEIKNVAMLGPYGEYSWPASEPIHSVGWQLINDYGGITKEVTKLP